MSTTSYLVSLINAQTSVLARHVYEHEAQYNIADKAMLKDDITNLRHTLDEIEQEIEKEEQEA